MKMRLKLGINNACLLASVCALLVSCAWSQPLSLPKIPAHPQNVIDQARYPILVLEPLNDLEVGAAVFSFPNVRGEYLGYLCNDSRRTDFVESFAQANEYLGDWQLLLAKAIVEALHEAEVSAYRGQNRPTEETVFLQADLRIFNGNYCQQHDWLSGDPTRIFSGETYLQVVWRFDLLCGIDNGEVHSQDFSSDALVEDFRYRTTSQAYQILRQPRLEGIARLTDQVMREATRGLLQDPFFQNVLVQTSQVCRDRI